jgi:AcrR family transcriptional regulator
MILKITDKRGVFVTTLCHTEATTQKKALIETSLLKLMAQLPYHEITVTDICRESEIPRRTFYHYFGNKEDVMESIIESLMQQCFLEVIFDIRLGKEHMKKCFATIFRFWAGENRKKLDVLIKNGLELRLLSWASQWIRKSKA